MGVAAKAAKVLSTIESAEIAGSDGVWLWTATCSTMTRGLELAGGSVIVDRDEVSR
jgi:hypothetical protein